MPAKSKAEPLKSATWPATKLKSKDALFVLVMPAAVGSFSFAPIQRAIKNPARGGAAMSLAAALVLGILFYLNLS